MNLKKRLGITLLVLVVLFYLPQKISVHLKLETLNLFKIPFKITFFIGRQLKNILLYPAIVKENEILRKKTAWLDKDRVHLSEMEHENRRLNALLSFKQQLPFKSIACRVISKDSSNWKKFITLDKGLNDGLYLEMPVAAPEGIVGWVKGISSNTAQVMLITDINSKAAALIQDTRIDGIVEGTGTEYCYLKFLESDAEIEIGQLIITSGLSSIFPKGLIIGKIEKVIYQRGQAEKKALVKPAAAFSRIEEVLCIDLNR